MTRAALTPEQIRHNNILSLRLVIIVGIGLLGTAMGLSLLRNHDHPVATNVPAARGIPVMICVPLPELEDPMERLRSAAAEATRANSSQKRQIMSGFLDQFLLHDRIPEDDWQCFYKSDLDRVIDHFFPTN